MQFLQSTNDFPLNVSLGKKLPSFGFHRFKQGLRFVPIDNESFTMRGDKRRLLYKGRRRSHRFTILGDCAFEYDCILEREPETNVITLQIIGAEHFDFFRQPDSVHDDFLKGSYAVYKKETLIGEGTGKLCHIHRPLIIDARGRRCWGTLAVAGNELHITIPDWFLSGAKYPVIVDPTIGTTTVGSQYLWDSDPPEPPVPLHFECDIPVNRFLANEAINGNCTAYFYTNDDESEEAGGCPVLYSDNASKPNARKSIQEKFIDFTVSGSKPKGWRSGAFSSNGSIAAGSYIWFGCFAKYFWYPRFDFGETFFNGYWANEDVIPNVYPIPDNNWSEKFKLSMYFTYTPAQNYVRVLTQGVKLTDSRKLKADYKRGLAQKAGVNSALSRFETFVRKFVMTVGNVMSISRLPVFFRTVAESVKVTTCNSESSSILRKCADGVNVNSGVTRFFSVIRKLQEIVNGTDTQYVSILFCRSVPDNVSVTHTFRHWGAFIRGLRVFAGSNAETRHKAEYYRYHADTVQAAGAVFRGLLLFVRIVTKVFIRDYLLSRFLIAREELILKSVVCREIILESKIN